MMARITSVVLALAISIGCDPSKRDGLVDAGTTAKPAPTTLTAFEAERLVDGACLACHSESLLAQQRLTQAQWNKVVTKMVGWGAPISDAEIGPLSNYLAAAYGTDRGPYELASTSLEAESASITKEPDGVYAGGDVERGKNLYIVRCSACHGADARGGLGTNLVDRPFLYRVSVFERAIRAGRGKMPSISMKDAELADVLAYLRTLRGTPP